jgi:uncharacterized protein with HEPN domain
VKDDRGYLNYILECIRRIEKHRRSGRRRFLSSDTIQDAVLRNLQTMAETTQRLSSEIKATQSHNPWEEISGFRNVLVHDYLGIDLETIWGIMQHEVPEVKTAIQAMLAALADDTG